MEPSQKVRTRRVSYEHGALDERDVERDPLLQFRHWIATALDSDIAEPNAMTLATVGPDGRPDARIVLLRGFDERGFNFYTNYRSRKARELEAHPQAALLFFWGEHERQIRIEGDVERLGAGESDAYFATRPRGHRVSAWASPQSMPVADRAYLEVEMARVEAQFADRDVARPDFWGGYRVVPRRFEFWQGHRDRVHDRVAYERAGDGWAIARLAP